MNTQPVGCRYLERVRFLIVEPNQFMRQVLRQLLRTFGAVEIAGAATSGEAFQQIARFRPDILLTEWLLSPQDGIEFVKRLRSEGSPDRLLPVIMVTAHAELANVIVARDAGVNEFVAKPFTAMALFRRVREVIERPRPFVSTEAYFGPDRRRRSGENYRGRKRRREDLASGGESPTQSEIDWVIAGEAIAEP
jgi:CheY-like chemotaxis protein